MDLKIGIITHYQEMKDNFEHLGKQLGCELIFRHGVLEYAVDVACQMERDLQVPCRWRKIR